MFCILTVENPCISRPRGVKCNFMKQPVDQHRLINLYNLHIYYQSKLLVIDNVYIIIQFICIQESQSGRVLNGELLYTKILEVNLFAFAYRLFHEDFSSIIADFLHRGMQKSPMIEEKSS